MTKRRRVVIMSGSEKKRVRAYCGRCSMDGREWGIVAGTRAGAPALCSSCSCCSGHQRSIVICG